MDVLESMSQCGSPKAKSTILKLWESWTLQEYRPLSQESSKCL